MSKREEDNLMVAIQNIVRDTNITSAEKTIMIENLLTLMEKFPDSNIGSTNPKLPGNVMDFTKTKGVLVGKPKRLRRRHRNVIIGTGEPSDLLKAAPVVRYIQVSCFTPDTTPDMVAEYITKKLPAIAKCVRVEALPSKTSFRVSLPKESLKEVLDRKFWPNGVAFKKWWVRF